MTCSESHFWKVRAAMLDPKAWMFVLGAPLNVPDGETWYSGSHWRMIGEDGVDSLYLRRSTALESVPLAPGTHWVNASAMAHVYVCNPKRVWCGDARYSKGKSARNLFYERMHALDSLPAHVLSLTFDGTEPMSTVISATFPEDFNQGMIRCASSFDVSWTALLHASGASGMNLSNEVSDDHQQRNAIAMLFPFQRAAFPSLECRNASRDGINGPGIAGRASVLYQKLPDWF